MISSPVHVQDFPARYSPQMGFEGANVIFDTWIHPLVMGLEEHLLTMFREDFEFHDEAGASHHGGKADLRDIAPEPAAEAAAPDPAPAPVAGEPVWAAAAERELKKIRSSSAARPSGTPRNMPPTGAGRDQRRNPLRGKGPLCAMTGSPHRT